MHKAIVALDKMKAKLDAVERLRSEPIAIIGMGCRFPGGADSPEAFFRQLQAGVDAVTQVPEERWQLESSKDTDASPERRAMRWGAFLRDPVDRFDARFFGISPREAAHLDPQQRLLLEVGWEALERAGLDPARLIGSTTGVFIGLTTDDYSELCAAAGPEGEDIYSATGNGHCFAAGRLSYAFGFQGPSFAVDTACSSSLVAVHLACQSLRAGEATLAMAGGVNLMLSPDTTRLTATTLGLSPDGRCKTFDAAANGFVRGEGCGLVILKRLSDAQRDGDRILALIRGSAVNQDGRSTGLTAPNVLSQKAMLQQALASARVAPEDIGYVEAHGTGTSLGDPIELEALRAVLGKPRADGSTCALGAAKSNIGHLEAAAGIAGLIKAVMALGHESIPGNLHFRTLNPRISLEGTPFVIPTASIPWKRGAKARVAGVSAFGMSGTNAHLILEEAARDRIDDAPDPAVATYLLPISARSPEALRAYVAAYAAMLARDDGPRLFDLVSAASLRRTHHEHRLAILGRTREEMAGALGVLLRNGTAGGVAQGRPAGSGRPKVVFVFPGQGSQWLGMGRQLFAEEPAFRSALETCDEAIRRHGSFSVLDEIAAEERRSRLAHIDIVQPVLFAIQVALAALFRAWGIEPDAVVGHSMGEVAAARVAGILSLDDAAKIICRRSRLLRRVSGKGAMALVELARPEAQLALAGYEDRLSVAVINGPQSTVISGDPVALAEVLQALEKREVFCRNVKVDVASHSPQMDPLREDLLSTLRNVRPRAARIPMRSTVTGEVARGLELDAAYWVKNLREPVLFLDATQRLIEEGHTVFVEMSPHPILVPSIEENLQEKRQEGAALASLRRHTDERRTMLEALSVLYARGHAVEWKRVYARESRHVALPMYPWQRERHWVRGPALTEGSPARRAKPESITPIDMATGEPREDWLWELEWRRLERAATTTAPPPRAWLVLADREGVGEALARRLQASGATCVRAVVGEKLRSIAPDLWEIDPADPDAYRALLHDAFPAHEPCGGVVHLFSLDAPSSEGTTTEVLARAQALGSESALLLAQAILQADFASTPALWLVTRGAVATSRGAGLAVAQAPLWGLGRTLQCEHPELACKLVDLGPEPADPAAEALFAELAPDDREDQIALRFAGRFVARLVSHEPRASVTEPERLHADATYLVTGGLGGLGLAVAGWMVKQGARHLALVGRSAPTEAARDAITRLEEAGATVLVATTDISRRGDVDALLARIDASQRPLRGLVHAAGILQDRTVLDLSIEAMRAVAAPKVQGAWNLHEATLPLPLDFFVMYGSAAAILGSPGQSNYAAANAFLDALAHDRRARGLPGLSLDWGPFSQVGLATAQSNRGERLSSRGFRSITPAEGHQVLGALLFDDFAQIGVMPMDVQRAIASMPQLTVAPYFSELVRTAKRAQQEPMSTSLSRSALRSASPADRRARLERLVAESLGHVMRLDHAQIDRTAPFHGYGFDSLMGLELRNRLQTALDLKLSMADIVTHAQIDTLAALLAERVALVVDASGSPPATEDVVVVAPIANAPPGSWIVIPRAVPEARMRLFCFPYAGGAASVFSTWPAGLPPEIELCAIQPPGRHERLHEPLLHSVDEMVDALVPAILPYLDRPFAVFGHCLGAIVMFETLRRLAALHGRRPAHVFASGAPAPPRYLVPSLAARPHEEFLELLRAIGFARAGVLEDEDAERHLLPAVKADFELAARYTHVPSPPFDAPITAFAGQDDSFAPVNIVDDWSRQTTSWSTKVVFPGEHYFIVPERDALLRIVGEELLLRLAVIEQRQRIEPDEGPSRAIAASPPRSAPRARLFCFPGLGRGSSVYESWHSALAEDSVEVCPIELAGRGARAGELPLGRIDEIVDHLLPLLRGHLDRPFAFFGLDLGALLMFEITRRLRRERGPQPGHLLVGAAMAPQVHYFAPMAHLARERLFAGLRLQGLTFDESALAERALRAECAAMTSYTFANEPPLDLPIMAFLGENDALIPGGGVRAWKEQTTASFAFLVDVGTHDLLRNEPSTLLEVVRATLNASPYR